MNNLEKLKNVFASALNIDHDIIIDDLSYQSIPEWDSLSHMILISEVETEFEVEIDTDDVIDLSNFAKAKEILKKLNVEI